MVKTFAAVTAASLALVAVPAVAQDWSGPYFGGYAGYQTQSQDKDERILFDTNLDGTYGDTVRTTAAADAFSPGFCDGRANGNNAAAGCSKDEKGAGEAGLRAGYDWQAGSWVFGVVGEYGVAGVTDAVTGFSTTPASYTFEREMNAMGAARARVGYAMGRYLPYVTAGYAVAQVENTYQTSNAANAFSPTRSSTDADGFQVGAGIEKRLTNSVSIGLEYIYSDLNDRDPMVVRTSQGTAPATNPFLLVNAAGTDQIRSNDSFQVHSFRVTGAIRF